VRTKWLRGGISLLALALVFASGWLTRNVLVSHTMQSGGAMVVQRDFAPALADARTPCI
jgi:hypothetical protein